MKRLTLCVMVLLLSSLFFITCIKQNAVDTIESPAENLEIIQDDETLISYEPEMVLIQGGNYLMGTNDYIFSSAGITDMLSDGVYSPHQVTIESFKISKYEISSELFLQFLQETGRNKFDGYNAYDSHNKYNGEEYRGYPAVSNYYYALDFCKWFGERNGKNYRLPTEAEWEYAATGGDGRIYPWGNEYQALGDTDVESPRVSINKYDKDKSPFGVMNMYGNVAEWTLDYYQNDAYLKHTAINPICIDGEQKSIDGYDSYPPTYIVRGRNKYYYRLEMIEPSVNEFATIKRRFPEPYFAFQRSSMRSCGFRIVEDIDITNFSTIHGPVTFLYEIYTATENANIYLEPKESSKILKSINKDISFQSSFLYKDSRGTNWLRIQTFEYSENTGGTRAGDDNVVGWIKLNYCRLET